MIIGLFNNGESTIVYFFLFYIYLFIYPSLHLFIFFYRSIIRPTFKTLISTPRVVTIIFYWFILLYYCVYNLLMKKLDVIKLFNIDLKVQYHRDSYVVFENNKLLSKVSEYVQLMTPSSSLWSPPMQEYC